jgi:hypothetical protein
MTVTILNPSSGGMLSNTRLAKTANYTVDNTDKGKTIALGGTAFYTLTFSAASGYDVDFAVIVVNEDSGRAKYISISGGTSFYLWPGQTVTVLNQNNTWQVQGKSRWKLPTGALTINTDFTNGSDTLGSADGLGTSGGALKTVNHALGFIRDQFDFDGTYENYTVLTVLMAAGSTDSTCIHYGSYPPPGAFGGQSITIDGNGGTLSGTTAGLTAAFAVYYGGIFTIQNVTITSTVGDGISVLWGGKVFLGNSVTFGATAAGSAQIHVLDGGRFSFNTTGYTISATSATGYHIVNLGGYISLETAPTATISNNITVTAMVVGAGPGYTNLNSNSWSLGGHTVTGKKYDIQANAVVFGTSTIPGSVAGTTASGGQAL